MYNSGNTGYDNPFIRVRNSLGAGGNIWEIDTLIKFNLSSIPTGSRILIAKIYLFYDDFWDNNPAKRFLTIRKITSDWKEESVDWFNQPSYNKTPTSETRISLNTGY